LLSLTATGYQRGRALRYIGEDVIWDDRPGTFITNPNLAKPLPPIDLTDGESLHGEFFPTAGCPANSQPISP
jgi:hypothetical protein